MNINMEKLVAEVKEKADKSQALQHEKEELERKIAHCVEENIAKIIVPELNDMKKVCEELFGYARKNDILTRKVLKTFENGKSALLYDVKTRGIVVYIERGVAVAFVEGLHSVENLLPLSDFFGTVDKSMEFVERLHKDFASILDYYATFFEQKNTELSEKINELKAQVEESSTVEEREDGTIELCLNGKVYIGTLKEA